jgi:hypothetical protein
MEISSMNEEVLPHSLKTVRSFLRTNDGGDPKSGPNRRARRIEYR